MTPSPWNPEQGFNSFPPMKPSVDGIIKDIRKDTVQRCIDIVERLAATPDVKFTTKEIAEWLKRYKETL